MKSINLGTAEVLYEKAVTDIENSTGIFYDVKDNSEIEKMGTEYVLKCGLTPVDFTIDLRDGSAIAEVPYQSCASCDVYSFIPTLQSAALLRSRP